MIQISPIQIIIEPLSSIITGIILNLPESETRYLICLFPDQCFLSGRVIIYNLQELIENSPFNMQSILIFENCNSSTMANAFYRTKLNRKGPKLEIYNNHRVTKRVKIIQTENWVHFKCMV